jgi:ribosomal protein L32
MEEGSEAEATLGRLVDYSRCPQCGGWIMDHPKCKPCAPAIATPSPWRRTASSIHVIRAA